MTPDEEAERRRRKRIVISAKKAIGVTAPVEMPSPNLFYMNPHITYLNTRLSSTLLTTSLDDDVDDETIKQEAQRIALLQQALEDRITLLKRIGYSEEEAPRWSYVAHPLLAAAISLRSDVETLMKTPQKEGRSMKIGRIRLGWGYIEETDIQFGGAILNVTANTADIKILMDLPASIRAMEEMQVGQILDIEGMSRAQRRTKGKLALKNGLYTLSVTMPMVPVAPVPDNIGFTKNDAFRFRECLDIISAGVRVQHSQDNQQV